MKEFGCELIFEEKVSAVKNRPELDKLLTKLRKNDMVVVWKLDRLGRSLKDLINLVSSFKDMDVEFISIKDHIDTTTAQGRLMFNLFATFAEFERELISERTKAGLAEAKKNGKLPRRPSGLTQKARNKAWAAFALKQQGEHSVNEIIKELGLSKRNYYRYMEWASENAETKS